MLIYPNVTIYHNCKFGDRAILHSGTVIGSDGFGFGHYNSVENLFKLYQLGAW